MCVLHHATSFGLHAEFVHDITNAGAVGGAVWALLRGLGDPRDCLPDGFLVLGLNEPIPSVVVGRGRGDGEEVACGGELHGSNFLGLGVGSGFEPLFGRIEVTWGISLQRFW